MHLEPTDQGRHGRLGGLHRRGGSGNIQLPARDTVLANSWGLEDTA